MNELNLFLCDICSLWSWWGLKICSPFAEVRSCW